MWGDTVLCNAGLLEYFSMRLIKGSEMCLGLQWPWTNQCA